MEQEKLQSVKSIFKQPVSRRRAIKVMAASVMAFGAAIAKDTSLARASDESAEPATLPSDQPANNSPERQSPATARRLDNFRSTNSPTETLSDSPGPAETGELIDQFSKEAVDIRYRALSRDPVLWTQDSDPGLRKSGEQYLKLLIATFEPATGNIGEAAGTLKKILKVAASRQNSDYLTLTNGPITDGYIFTISNQLPQDGGLPIKTDLAKELIIKDSKVVSRILVTINPTFLALLTGDTPEARQYLGDAKGDLSLAYELGYAMTKAAIFNDLLSQDAVAYGAGKTAQEIKEFLSPERERFLVQAKSIAEDRSAASAKELVATMPNFWRVSPVMEGRLGG